MCSTYTALQYDVKHNGAIKYCTSQLVQHRKYAPVSAYFRCDPFISLLVADDSVCPGVYDVFTNSRLTLTWIRTGDDDDDTFVSTFACMPAQLCVHCVDARKRLACRSRSQLILRQGIFAH